MSEREFWMQQRAAIIMQAKAVKQQYDGLMQQLAVIERMYDIEKKQTAHVSPIDSIAVIMTVNEGSKA